MQPDGGRRIERARRSGRRSDCAGDWRPLRRRDAVASANRPGRRSSRRSSRRRGGKSDLAAALTAVRDRYRGRVGRRPSHHLRRRGYERRRRARRRGHAAGLSPSVSARSSPRARSRDPRRYRRRAGARRIRGSISPVSAVSHGTRRPPIELRLLENGRPSTSAGRCRRAKACRCVKSFRSRPGPGRRPSTPSRSPVASGELVPENNKRSVLVQPPSRPRRVLSSKARRVSSTASSSGPGPGTAASSSIPSSARGRTSRAATRSTSRQRRPRGGSLTIRLPRDARSALSLRRARAGKRRWPPVQPRAARVDARVRQRARRRPARARGAIVPAPGSERHRAGRSAAARPDRAGRQAPFPLRERARRTASR